MSKDAAAHTQRRSMHRDDRLLILYTSTAGALPRSGFVLRPQTGHSSHPRLWRYWDKYDNRVVGSIPLGANICWDVISVGY